MNRTRAIVAVVAFVLAAPLAGAPRPAAADGAASTRNIILGGAAATAGTLIWLNHNKKVHEKYAQYDARQAATQAQANDAEASYENERAAYGHEAALVSEYQTTISYQHEQVLARDREIAGLEHSLLLAKASARRASVASGVTSSSIAVPADRRSEPQRAAVPAVTYGWGSY